MQWLGLCIVISIPHYILESLRSTSSIPTDRCRSPQQNTGLKSKATLPTPRLLLLPAHRKLTRPFISSSYEDKISLCCTHCQLPSFMTDFAAHDGPSDPSGPPSSAGLSSAVEAAHVAVISDELKARLDKVIYSDVSYIRPSLVMCNGPN